MTRSINSIFGLIGLICIAWGVCAADLPTQPARKPSLAVLPFVALTGDAKELDLAQRMRFAVSQKLSTDANGTTPGGGGGAYDRLDNVQIDNVASALQISFAAPPIGPPDDAEIQKLLAALNTQWTIAGTVKGRTLSLTLYEGTKVVKTASIDIPPDNESPKLAVEKILTELTGAAFVHIRDVEADHSNPQIEARFAARPNLLADPHFALAAQDPRKVAANWQAILGADHYPPPLVSAKDAADLADDRVAIGPRSAAGIPATSAPSRPSPPAAQRIV